MSDANKDVKFFVKVMVNKQKTKVLFAEADSSFADVLLSFLTLPLGRIVRILKNHYRDNAPALGSLTTLYNGLANLDSVHFWTQGAKSILLHPRSSFDAERKSLSLDISDPPPSEYFVCKMSRSGVESVSMYNDNAVQCRCCSSDHRIRKEAAKKDTQSSSGGVATISRGSFLITDNLQMMPATGLLQNVSVLGTTAMNNAVLMNVTFGFAEVMDLLKASLISSTPLSDVILKKAGQMNSATRKILTIPRCVLGIIGYWHTLILKKTGQVNSTTKQHGVTRINLKLMVQKSKKKLLYAEAQEDFVEFLFGLLIIPLGEVESLLSRNSSIKAIENLYTSVADSIDDKHFKNPDAKDRLIKPKIPHGYISNNYILPLTEETLPSAYKQILWHASLKFPKGQGNYLIGPQTYKVEDDLTATPFCGASIISYLNQLKIPISDVKELQVQIGLEEGLSILKASLTSTSAITDALLNRISNK